MDEHQCLIPHVKDIKIRVLQNEWGRAYMEVIVTDQIRRVDNSATFAIRFCPFCGQSFIEENKHE